MRLPIKVAAPLAALALLAAGCGTDETPLPKPTKSDTPAAATPATCTNDSSTLESYDPARNWPGGAVQRIQAHGQVVIGVSADTYRMAAEAGDSVKLEGFDIDIAKAIAKKLFAGSDQPLGKLITWKVITSADRIPDLQDGSVDLVVRNMTITCDRWEQVAFSAQYYHATQKMLFRGQELADSYHAVSDLAGLRICAPTGSTSLTNISQAEPKAIIDPAATHTGCLVKLQEGEVDAITGDDTVLAGLAAQDPYAVVPDDQPDLEPSYGEPYGVAVNSDDKDLAAFINGVLVDLHDSGQWEKMYHRWLGAFLPADNPGATQPTPLYGRGE